MLWFIFLPIVLATILGFLSWLITDDYTSRWMTWWGVFISAYLVLLGIAIFSDNSDPEISYKDYRDEIVSVQDGQEISGSFTGSLFVFSGYVNQESAFFYYIQNEDGSYVQRSAPARLTKVYEDVEEKDARIDSKYRYYDVNCWTSIGCPMSSYSEDNYAWSYEIHIPKGTVVKDFTLNGPTK